MFDFRKNTCLLPELKKKMINIAGFAKEGAREDNVYGHKREWKEDPFHLDEETVETSNNRGRKNLKLSPDYLASRLDKEVIPNQWFYGPQEIQKKGDKNTFYCEVCHVELNSFETMKSHTQGSKHQNKMLKLEEEHKDKIRRGLADPHARLPGVKPIPNPPSAKIKVPTRLQERIRVSDDPVVGLRYIKEFLSESDPEMEPHYECRLCGNKGTSNSMFSHIMGGKHRQLFAERIGHRGTISQMDLLRLARDNNENNSRMSGLMETIRSDVEYPAWPAGKAPWAVEKGGSGVLPFEVRSSSTSSSTRSGARSDSMSGRTGARIGKLHPDYQPQTGEEAEKMISVGRKLLETVVMSEYVGLTRAEKDMIIGNLGEIFERGKDK